ncbi:hypothetical protein [Bradyrhizobium sp.]|uniref:hypothetical protein n=1 Tax=Bradyrhizobium sp. TaxID=376 RepID=UPI004037EA2C
MIEALKVFAGTLRADIAGFCDQPGGNMDVLSEVLRVIRVSGAIHFNAGFTRPWSVVTSPPDLLASRLMPGAEAITLFHLAMNAGRRASHFGFSKFLSSPKIKKISLYRNSDLRYAFPRPGPAEGRFANRHDALGLGCDGRGRLRRNGSVSERDRAAAGRKAAADGEVVWSWRRDPGVYPCWPVPAGQR